MSNTLQISDRSQLRMGFDDNELGRIGIDEKETSVTGTILDEQGRVVKISGTVLGAEFENPWFRVGIGIWPDGHMGTRIGQKMFLLQQLGLHLHLQEWRHEKPPRLPARCHES